MKKNNNAYAPYYLMSIVYAIFLVFAFVLQSPVEIINGIWKIITSRSILITDYIEIAGIGATLINSAVVGSFSILMLLKNKIIPNGAIFMALWMTTGFAFFGKNLFNMLPITLGVYLFSKHQKEPFHNYALVSLLASTLSPVVSEISFLGVYPFPYGIIIGAAMGIFVGFIFPSVSAFTLKSHLGYCLYNLGFAGGLIASLVVSIMKSLGLDIYPELHWSNKYSFTLALLMYIISLILISYGIYLSPKGTILKGLKRISKQTGRLVSDYYSIYRNCSYINMGILTIIATTVILVLGADLNGPTIGGILTITGFGCFGKHPRNVLPLMFGAILSTYFNKWDPTSSANTLAILFSTGLAPIAGQFGWAWGIVAGFIHVNLANNISSINGGLNLYNNGFAAGLVAIFLVPIILIFQKDEYDDEV